MLLTTSRSFNGHRLGGPLTLEVQGERVASIAEDADATRSGAVGLPEGWLLAPGFVDVHCHGGGGASFSDGSDGIEQVLTTHRSAGTTSMMASTVTESVDDLSERARSLGPFVSAGELLGIHLEGPWLSPAYRGAHEAELLQTPSWESFERVANAAPGAVRMVTLAPELPGGTEFVTRLVARGVVAAVGHTDATHAQATAAFDAGVSAATHLFNAMRGIHHREPGPVTAALERDDVWVELIADGVHLAPPILRAAMRVAGDRAVLVTDAMAAAGQPDGDYRLGGLAVRVTDGVARLAAGGAIAGSTLTMAEAVRYAINTAGVRAEAVLRAATSAPATMVRAEDVGRLGPGTWADAVVLDEEWVVRGVLRHGKWVKPLPWCCGS